MGIKLFRDSSRLPNDLNANPNPNPSNFKIITGFYGKNYSLILVKYIGCTTFEGRKILLVKGREKSIKKLKQLDPHFFEDHIVLARFIPNEFGMTLARSTFEKLEKESAHDDKN